MSNFVPIGCYLLFNPYINILCITFGYKKLKFKHVIDNITINFRSFRNFTSMKDLKSKYNSMVDLSKFTLKKKINLHFPPNTDFKG